MSPPEMTRSRSRLLGCCIGIGEQSKFVEIGAKSGILAGRANCALHNAHLMLAARRVRVGVRENGSKAAKTRLHVSHATQTLLVDCCCLIDEL